MRVAPFAAPSSPAGRRLAAVLVPWLAGIGAAGAAEIATSAVRGFAEQKIDGMTPAGAALDGAIDASRPFVGTASLQPAGCLVGDTSAGMSLPAGERVLRPLQASDPRVGGGFDPGNAQATDFAEAFLDGEGGEGVATLAGGASDWVVARGFRIEGTDDARAAASFDFGLAERLVAESRNPEAGIATASSAFALDIVDATGRSVFEPFMGTDPSTTRMPSSPAAGSMAYDDNTLVVAHVAPGPASMNVQAMPLATGARRHAPIGTTTSQVMAAPEPATHVSLAIAAACGCVRWWRGRCRRRRA